MRRRWRQLRQALWPAQRRTSVGGRRVGEGAGHRLRVPGRLLSVLVLGVELIDDLRMGAWRLKRAG